VLNDADPFRLLATELLIEQAKDIEALLH
jgi:hypothetical protein